MPHIIVIGGGASGLMAAGQSAESGTQVTLLEKMPTLGRKLAITGKGRCNLTNIATVEDFIGHFGSNGKFLYQAFSRFFSDDLLAFFNKLGIETVTERGGRVFPTTNAMDVVSALASWIRRSGVRIHVNQRVTSLVIRNKRLAGIQTQSSPQSGEPSLQFPCDAAILATGGASYPATGSSGDGYRLAGTAGHSITMIRPALVPLETEGNTAKRLQGLSLRNAGVSVWSNGQKKSEAFGEMLFTHFGISGPVILTLSHEIVGFLEEKEQVEISIDLKPGLDDRKLEARLIREFNESGKKHYSTLLKGFLPGKMIPVFAERTEIPGDKPVHQITADERRRFRSCLKDFRLKVTKHRPLDEAIVTAGGISLKEINPKTMESRLVQGLYFAGETLDLDADTGGYNLQAAFSTGWLAGQSAAKAVLGQDQSGTHVPQVPG